MYHGLLVRKQSNDLCLYLLQVGTAVVTRHTDNRLALGRLGSLVEQLHALVRSGRQVILVTSGAVCVGRQVRELHPRPWLILERSQLPTVGILAATGT